MSGSFSAAGPNRNLRIPFLRSLSTVTARCTHHRQASLDQSQTTRHRSITKAQLQQSPLVFPNVHLVVQRPFFKASEGSASPLSGASVYQSALDRRHLPESLPWHTPMLQSSSARRLHVY